jgi:hypothetical protein
MFHCQWILCYTSIGNDDDDDLHESDASIIDQENQNFDFSNNTNVNKKDGRYVFVIEKDLSLRDYHTTRCHKVYNWGLLNWEMNLISINTPNILLARILIMYSAYTET